MLYLASSDRTCKSSNDKGGHLNGSYLSCHHLLQCVLALGVRVVSHDDHYDRHEFVH